MNNNQDRIVRGFLGMGQNRRVNSDGQNFKDLVESSGWQDPTFLGFTVRFWDQRLYEPRVGRGFLDTASSMTGLLLDDSDVDSAANYLLRTGYGQESIFIKKFRSILMDLQTTKPWYIQSISGLASLMEPLKDGKNIRAHESVLEFECLESMDMRMSFLADLHKKGTYDMVWKRNLLPQEKRRFNVDIIIAEIRNLRSWDIKEETVTQGTAGTTPPAGAGNTQGNAKATGSTYSADDAAENTQTDAERDRIAAKKGKKTSGDVETNDDGTFGGTKKPTTGIKAIDDLASAFTNNPSQGKDTSFTNVSGDLVVQHLENDISYHVIRCLDCEFEFGAAPWVETVSNVDTSTAATMRFKINVGDAYEINQYGFFNWVLDDMKIHSAVPDDSTEALQKYSSQKKNHGALHFPAEGGTSSSVALQNTYEAMESKKKVKSFGKGFMDTMEAKWERWTYGLGPDVVGEHLDDITQISRVVGEVTGTNHLADAERAWKKKMMDISSSPYNPGGLDLTDPGDLITYGIGIKDELTGKNKDSNYTKPAIDMSNFKNIFGAKIIDDPLSENGRVITRSQEAGASWTKHLQDKEMMSDYIRRAKIGDNPQADSSNSPSGSWKNMSPKDGFPLSKGGLGSNIHENDTGYKPNKGIDQYDLTGYEPEKGVDQYEHTGYEPEKGIDQVDLTGYKPNKGIDQYDLTGYSPEKGVDQYEHTGYKPEKGVDQYDLTGYEPKKGVDQFDLTGYEAKKGIDQIDNTNSYIKSGGIDQVDLTGYAPSKGIDQVDLTGYEPSGGIDQVDLTGYAPSEGIDQVDLTGYEPTDGIDQVDLTGYVPSKGIEQVELTGYEPTDGIDQVDLTGYEPDRTINPSKIKYDIIKLNKKITPKNIHDQL